MTNDLLILVSNRNTPSPSKIALKDGSIYKADSQDTIYVTDESGTPVEVPFVRDGSDLIILLNEDGSDSAVIEDFFHTIGAKDSGFGDLEESEFQEEAVPVSLVATGANPASATGFNSAIQPDKSFTLIRGSNIRT